MSVIRDDLKVLGSLSATVLVPSAGTVQNAQIAAGAAIDPDKLAAHVHKRLTDFGLSPATEPSADVSKYVFVADRAATLRSFGAKLVDTGTSTDIKFDLQRAAAGSTSFVSMLSGTIDFTHADADNTAKAAPGFSSIAIAAGDVLRIDMDWTSATGAAGPLAWLDIEETT